MGSAISRLLCVPIDDTHRRTLLLKPPSICRACWEGPFAVHLKLFAQRGQPAGYSREYSYFTSCSKLQTGASTGCLWCRFILAVVLEGRDSVDPTWSGATFGVIVESDRVTPRDCAPRKMRELMVSIDSELYFLGYVHTAAGTFISTLVSAGMMRLSEPFQIPR